MMTSSGPGNFWTPWVPDSWFIQSTAEAKSEAEAKELLAGMVQQVDYRGGRVLPAVNGTPWRVQGFYETNGEAPAGWLPDGLRHVLVPAGMRRTLGLET